MQKVAFYTLGCKVNQVETEQIKEDFINQGYQVVDFSQPADVYVINTCTVTHISDRKSRAALRRAIRQNPGASIVATGCLAQVNAKEIAAIEGVNLVVGSNYKHRIADLVNKYREQPGGKVIMAGQISPQDRPQKSIYTLHHKRTRGFVKIEDGCENFCSYCIVPLARGPVRSKLPEDVQSEIENMVSLGYGEIVLTGINTGLYGQDLNDCSLDQLLEYITAKVAGDYRLRLSSIEPLELSSRLLELVAGSQRICRHLHIPLQSGSDPILQKMGRRYTAAYYRNLILEIAYKIPGAAVTTDIMTGFPGETEAHFADTYTLLQDLPIYNMHVFKYSRRAGTRAAEMEEQIPEPIKQQRSAALLELANNKRQTFIKSQIGQTLTALAERRIGPGRLVGITDNYINVEFSSSTCVPGQFIKLKINELKNGQATGEAAHDS